ncbi:hypothetical protein [Puniceibacterium confluentis]|nr:hypothetical protein [Puniceibacterium confluentis]
MTDPIQYRSEVALRLDLRPDRTMRRARWMPSEPRVVRPRLWAAR